MDIPVKKMLKLLQSDREPELRAAAVAVLAELGVKDAELNGELLKCLDDKDAGVRVAAIKAAGQLKLAKALPQLLERIKHGGEESHLSADAAAKLGAEGVKGLEKLLHTVAPGLRRYIAASLTSAGSGGAEAGLKVLLDKDPQIAAGAANAIIGRIPTMPEAGREELLNALLAVAKQKAKVPPQAEMPIIRIFASLNDPRAADAVWDRTQPPYAYDVRAAALQAAGGWLQNPTKEHWKKLFACGTEKHFNVLAPALAILGRLPFNEKQSAEWLGLMHAPDLAARKLAMDKLGDRDTPEYAALLMDQLGHVDQNLRDTARAKLAKLEHGRAALVKALLQVESNDELWQLARLVAPFAKGFAPKLRADIRTKASKYLEAGDHRSDPLFFLLKEGDASALRDELLESAVAKRKKKDYEGALQYLKLAARDPAAGFPTRLELAMNGLKASPKEVAAEARAIDPCLRQFSNILEQNADEAEKEVLKAKWLDAEDLFYLGFHFAEQNLREKKFGAAVLQGMVKANPKSKLAANAKNKLKTLVL
jgi:HEAT repeat protein